MLLYTFQNAAFRVSAKLTSTNTAWSGTNLTLYTLNKNNRVYRFCLPLSCFHFVSITVKEKLRISTTSLLWQKNIAEFLMTVYRVLTAYEF